MRDSRRTNRLGWRGTSLRRLGGHGDLSIFEGYISGDRKIRDLKVGDRRLHSWCRKKQRNRDE